MTANLKADTMAIDTSTGQTTELNPSAGIKILFFPTLAAMVFDALLVIVDGIFIGHGVSPSVIAAAYFFDEK